MEKNVAFEGIPFSKERFGYPELLYATLFHPVQLFRALAAEAEPTNRALFYAILSVIFISALVPVIQFINIGGKPVILALLVPVGSIIGTLMWLFTALIVSMLSYAFSGRTRFKTLLILSGLATLPWMLMGPISLLKVGLGPLGVVLCAILGLCIWLWAVLLFALAIVSTYALTAERVMIILAAPFVMTFVFASWVLGFFGNISNLIPR